VNQESTPVSWHPSRRSIAEQLDDIKAAAPSPGVSPHRLWQIIRKRKSVVISTVILCLIAAGVWLLSPPTYQATGTLQVRPGSSDTYRVAQAAQMALGSDSDELIDSATYTLQTRTLLLRVAQELKLQNRDEFLPKSLVGTSLEDPRTRDVLFKTFAKAIHIEHVPKTDIITISCKTDDPRLSAAIVNSLVSNYIAWLYETRYGSSRRAADWLKDELKSMYQQIESDQAKLITMRKDLGFLGTDSQTNVKVLALQSLFKNASEAQVDRMVSEVRYQNLAEGPSVAEGGQDLLPTPNTTRSPSSLLTTLRTQSGAADAEYARLASQFGANYPGVREAKAQAESLHRQVGEEQSRIVDQAKQALTAAQSYEKQAVSALNRQESALYNQGDKLLDFQILEYNQQMNRQLYQGLVQHLRESTITAGLDAAEVDVIDIADCPYLRYPFGWSVALGAAGVGGIFLGLVLAFVFNSLDQRLASVEEVENAAGSSAWAVCPFLHSRSARKLRQAESNGSGELQTREIELLSLPKSQFSEAIRVLRSSLLFLSADQSTRVVMATSSAPGEGKSTIVSNLAACLAAKGDRTILIDCDLRRPAVAKRFSLPNRVGLSSVLSGRASLEEAIVSLDSVEGLDVLPSGPIPPLPVELLSSDVMKSLLQTLRSTYRFVVIDAPPALMLSDALVLAAYCDAIAIVVRLGGVNRGVLTRTLAALRRTANGTSGVIVNAVDNNVGGDYGYYGVYGYSAYVTD
jgi:polysaccharide biosynthesis transport protein